MRRGLSLVQLAQKITSEQALKADYVVPANQIGLTVDGDRQIGLDTPAGVFPAVRPVAHGQLASYAGVPKPYYDRMLREAPELLVTNVNEWLSRSQDRRMVRTLGGDARAFLSDRYNRVENFEIAEVVLPILQEAGAQLVSCEVTETRMYISAITSKVTGQVKVGDEVQAGVTITNSEVGHGAVGIAPLVWRLRCLNGMIVPDGKLRANHVGRRVQEGEDLNRIFADDTRKADDRALMLKVRDTVRHALDAVKFRATVEKMAGLTEGRVTGNPEKVVEVLAQKIGATEGERGGLLRSLIEGGDLTAWGLLNAVTHQAHGAADYDRSMDFVAAGGKLLELPKSEWRTILEAA